jgi:TRAP-type uncharacterized transport system fused permease subunit
LSRRYREFLIGIGFLIYLLILRVFYPQDFNLPSIIAALAIYALTWFVFLRIRQRTRTKKRKEAPKGQNRASSKKRKKKKRK